MLEFDAVEKSTQFMIDCFIEGSAEEIEPKSKIYLSENHFETTGYVIYWMEREQFLTPLIEDRTNLFHGLITWAKQYKTLEDAKGVAMLLLQSGAVINTGFKIFKVVTNEAAVIAAEKELKSNTKKKRKFTGENDSPKYVMLLSPVWSNFPFDDENLLKYEFYS